MQNEINNMSVKKLCLIDTYWTNLQLQASAGVSLCESSIRFDAGVVLGGEMQKDS